MKTCVEVTKNDIAKGTPEDTLTCPIALRLQKLIKPGVEVEVHSNYISLNGDNAKFGYDEFDLPSRAQDFIKMFDTLGDVEPFSFNINIPVRYLKTKRRKPDKKGPAR